MKNRIRLTEGDLHKIIKNSVKKVINEASNRIDENYYRGLTNELIAVREKLFGAYREINSIADRCHIDFNPLYKSLDKAIKNINQNIEDCDVTAKISSDYADYEAEMEHNYRH